ncbi:MAG: VWA domain-containing protein [Muribaculaceae bacterium]|nr:VWA domain-containing protein [Muribaculaceae bacterium]MDY4650302.1 VWA domain-containing protein [Muribaculaceae bacterium]
MIFAKPYLLFLLILIIPLVAWYVWKWRKSDPSVGVSTVAPILSFGTPYKVWLMHVAFALQVVAVAAIIVALARPQTHDSQRSSSVEGTDIVLALDISSSMLANDLQPNRIQAAKEVASKFVSRRDHDNIGLVVFSGESLSLMPLTTDRASVINAIAAAQTGALNDGTAIGDGIASAINRLISGQAKSKSIILLTDGTNNAGDVAPATAAQIAKQKGIRIYAIGVGTNGSIQITDPYGFSTTTMETKIDEAALKSIASTTGGKYFRATDTHTLRNVFAEIDQLEKSKINVNNYTQTEENFLPWILTALVALSISLLLRYTILRRVP